MASASLSSLLGLAPPPVIAPSAAEKRLSKPELRVATAAFHRARGYGDRVDFPRFRDTVLHEAFGAMPLYAMQRVFATWTFGDGSTGGALTLKEFVVGVAIAWKGARDELLKFAFQLMDRSGSQELTRRDAVAFLRCVALRDGVVAIEEPSGRRWSVDEFAAMLFPTDKTVYSPAKFLKTLASKSFSLLALIDWIPKLAAQFEREKLKLSAAVTPVAQPVASPRSRDEESDSLMDTIMVKLRLFNNEHRSALKASTMTGGGPASPSSNTLTSDQAALASRHSQSDLNLIQIEPIPADQFQKLKTVVANLVEWVLAAKEPISDFNIRDRLLDVVPTAVLHATMETASACTGDFLPLAVPTDQTDRLETEPSGCPAKARLMWWLICICCSCARSSPEVLRYLYVLFDEESRGYWTRAQLTRFILCADIWNEDQSSSVEAEFLAQTVFDEMATHQPAVKQEDPPSGDLVLFRFRDFERYLARFPISGCRPADIEVVFTLLHAQLAKHRGHRLSHRSYLEALHGYCDQLVACEVTTQLGFALAQRPSWERLVEWMCDYDAALPLVSVLKTQVCTVIDTLAGTGMSIAEDGDVPVVAVPIRLWLVLALKLHERRAPQATKNHSSWAEMAASLSIPSIDSRSADSDADSWSFRAMVVTLHLTVVARDASEFSISVPHCVVDQEITLQTLVQTTLTLHGRGNEPMKNGSSGISSHAKGAFFCEGEIEFSAQNGRRRQIPASPGVLLMTIGTLDEGAASHHASVTMNVLLTDERSSSYVPRWPTSMIGSPASSQRSGASTPSSRTPKQAKRSATAGWTQVHGLANLGNTCFMNSALQCLAATPLLREYFLKGEHLYDLSTHVVSSTSGPAKPPPRKGSMDAQLPPSSLLPIAFGQLLAEMNAYSSNGSVSGMADVISPKYMKTAIATLFPHLSDGSQQDAQEFLSSLLSSLSDELKRLPTVEIEPRNGNDRHSALVSSPSLFSQFASLSRQKGDHSSPPTAFTPRHVSAQALLSKLRFQVNDSNGQSDELAAKEWWIAHLISEPSVITALFCGQFKSSLRCTRCGNMSTRFEPFSSLQLPLLDEAAILSPRKKAQNQQIVLVLHFLDSPCHRSSQRLVVHAGLDWTVQQLLIKLQQDHTTFSSTGTRREHIAVTLNGFTVDDYVDPDALLSTVPTPINVFEIEFGDQARAFGQATAGGDAAEASGVELEPGTKVLARASHDRWVRAVVERAGVAPPKASGSLSPIRQEEDMFHVRIEEASVGSSVCLARNDLCARRTDRLLLLRFVHRRPGLVPFYSTSPYRQILCGFPFVCRLPTSSICGRGLYHLVHGKFVADTCIQRRSFVLKRVRSDGKSCGQCHWSEQCDGCKIDRLDEEPLDLDMDETIAIDWVLDTHEPVEEWLANGCSIEDHSSYVVYKLDNTHSLEKSLEILCSEEQVEARCSRCSEVSASSDPASSAGGSASENGSTLAPTSAFLPHTKTLGLWALPPILVIQLKRFELVADGGYSWQRLNHSVDFNVEGFDVARFLVPSASDPFSAAPALHDRDEVQRAEAFLTAELQFPTQTASREVSSYALYSIVNHMGDLGGGHYTAHIRHPDNADWWLVDDASATPANPQTLSPSSSAYLLFYVRDDLNPNGSEDEDESGLAATRPRGLSDFYPCHANAAPVADHVMRVLCKQDGWPRRSSSARQNGKRDDINCVLM